MVPTAVSEPKEKESGVSCEIGPERTNEMVGPTASHLLRPRYSEGLFGLTARDLATAIYELTVRNGYVRALVRLLEPILRHNFPETSERLTQACADFEQWLAKYLFDEAESPVPDKTAQFERADGRESQPTSVGPPTVEPDYH